MAFATVRMMVGNRLRSFRQCAKCGELKSPKDVHVDHVRAIGSPPTEGFSFSSEAWLQYLRRLGGRGNLQILCRPCHILKTKDDVVGMRGANEAPSKPEDAGRPD